MTEPALPVGVPLHGEPGAATSIRIPAVSMVVLVAAAGCGKSTFARRHFRPTEILSSDFFRAMVADAEADQTATDDAFTLLHLVARMRLRRGRLTVIDATNTTPAARQPLVAIARETDAVPVALVLDVPEEVCQARNRARTHRQVPPHAIIQHTRELHEHLGSLSAEGFRHVFVLREGEIDALETIIREPPENDLRRDALPDGGDRAGGGGSGERGHDGGARPVDGSEADSKA